MSTSAKPRTKARSTSRRSPLVRGRTRRLPVTDPALNALVFAGAWLLKTRPGEYLDVEVDAATGQARYLSVTPDRVRHAFRMRDVQDVRTRQWHVELEAVPFAAEAPRPARATASKRAGAARGVRPVQAVAAPPVVAPMRLVHHGCLSFELHPRVEGQAAKAKASKAPARRAAMRRGGKAEDSLLLNAVPAQPSGVAPPPAPALPPGVESVTIDLRLEDFAQPSPPAPFPTFEGDQQLAYASFVAQMSIDPRDPKVTVARIDVAERPKTIPKVAWLAVRRQLLDEISAREACRDHFHSLTEFVHNVFHGTTSKVRQISDMMSLEIADNVNLLMPTLFSAVAGTVSMAPFPGASVVGKCLDVAFKAMPLSSKPSQEQIVVAVRDAENALIVAYDHLITAIQELQARVLTDWAKLQALAAGVDAKTGTFCWPTNDEDLRVSARKAIEIQLWKAMLKLKWRNCCMESGASFEDRWTAQDSNTFQTDHPQYWVKFWPGQQAEVSSTRQGVFVEKRWLGYGRASLFNVRASDEMARYLFDTLGVSRYELFTDATWGLAAEPVRGEFRTHWSRGP